jgi:hypothetical protein
MNEPLDEDSYQNTKRQTGRIITRLSRTILIVAAVYTISYYIGVARYVSIAIIPVLLVVIYIELRSGIRFAPDPTLGKFIRSRMTSGASYSTHAFTESFRPEVTGIEQVFTVSRRPTSASYMNKLGQTVNPLTGQTVAPIDPFAHIPLPPR